MQWVMNGCPLTIAVLVVTAGRLGNMLGRKRLLLSATPLLQRRNRTQRVTGIFTFDRICGLG